jgi:hypothetical protein
MMGSFTGAAFGFAGIEMRGRAGEDPLAVHPFGRLAQRGQRQPPKGCRARNGVAPALRRSRPRAPGLPRRRSISPRKPMRLATGAAVIAKRPLERRYQWAIGRTRWCHHAGRPGASLRLRRHRRRCRPRPCSAVDGERGVVQRTVVGHGRAVVDAHGDGGLRRLQLGPSSTAASTAMVLVGQSGSVARRGCSAHVHGAVVSATGGPDGSGRERVGVHRVSLLGASFIGGRRGRRGFGRRYFPRCRRVVRSGGCG